MRALAESQERHNSIVAGQLNKARMAGILSHEAYLRLSPPGTPETLEFFAVDVWMNASGMAQHYADPEFLHAFQELFVAQPSTSRWVHPAGDWVEW
jgi:hypothetical protein